MPSYLLIPPKPDSNLYKLMNALPENQTVEDEEPHPFWVKAILNTTAEEDLQRKRTYRSTPTDIATLRSIMMAFEGSHNFYNFTVQRDFHDMSARRFMKSIEVSLQSYIHLIERT